MITKRERARSSDSRPREPGAPPARRGNSVGENLNRCYDDPDPEAYTCRWGVRSLAVELKALYCCSAHALKHHMHPFRRLRAPQHR